MLEYLRTLRAVVLCVVLFAVGHRVSWSQTSQQEPPRVTVGLHAWQISHLDSIRSGQLSVIDDPAGPRLVVNHLAQVAPADSGATYRSYRPSASERVLTVSDFDHENRNRLGGYFNVFQRPPSEAWLSSADAPDGSRALEFRGSRGDEGFCGMWIHLFDLGLPVSQREYLDIRPFDRLEFYVHQDSSDARFLLKMADAKWEALGDAVVLGELSDFVDGSTLGNEWLRVAVPLDEIPARLDR
ncbi:MAG: hypothetical protein R3282_08645, partial [Rhodothermales bacterium]|nr:hypothetical protein [Rhodothermales bacterium]